MPDEVTTLFNDVVLPTEDLVCLVMCTNREALMFCEYYDVNIWTFVDIAFSKSTH